VERNDQTIITCFQLWETSIHHKRQQKLHDCRQIAMHHTKPVSSLKFTVMNYTIMFRDWYWNGECDTSIFTAVKPQ